MLTNRNKPTTSAADANRTVNRIVTYALVLFLVYAVYTGQPAKRNPNLQTNYSPINWCGHITVKNLTDGSEQIYDIREAPAALTLTREDLKKQKPNTPIFEITNTEANCNLLPIR